MTTQEILEAARAARSALGLSSGEVRRAALLGMAEALCSPARQRPFWMPMPPTWKPPEGTSRRSCWTGWP